MHNVILVCIYTYVTTFYGYLSSTIIYIPPIYQWSTIFCPYNKTNNPNPLRVQYPLLFCLPLYTISRCNSCCSSAGRGRCDCRNGSRRYQSARRRRWSGTCWCWCWAARRVPATSSSGETWRLFTEGGKKRHICFLSFALYFKKTKHFCLLFPGRTFMTGASFDTVYD